LKKKKPSELLETEVSFLIKNAFVLVELPCSSSLVQANLGGEKASLSKNIRKQHFLPTTTCLWDWLALTDRRGVPIKTYLVLLLRKMPQQRHHQWHHQEDDGLDDEHGDNCNIA